ncbi:MAG: Ribosomal RNA small subunit methyltransferase B [Chlamydiae bacterium]|nr:Ribosomal RNA small subunit methyltransferase B [Chlamydiota bacterium]
MLPFRQYHLFQLFAIFKTDRGPLDLTIARYFRQHKALGSKDRKKIAEIVYHLVRWSGLFDYFIPHKKDWESRYEVYQKLDLAEAIKNPDLPLHIRTSFPKVLIDYWVQSYGAAEAEKLALMSNDRAPITLRANALKISREDFIERFKSEIEMEAASTAPYAIRVLKRTSLFQLDAFKEGFFEMQDEASQLIAELVSAEPRQKVLDYCAGSGGKSLAIAPRMKNQGVLYLHDIREGILIQAKKRLKRAGIQNAQILSPNDPQINSLKGNMDWVLVDAPCSGSGTYRRNPDLKWKFSKEMLENLIETQRMIVKEAMSYLKPQGRLVYATCSLFQEENEKQVDYFEKNLSLKLDGEVIKTKNKYAEMDGFFGAILVKN